MHDSGRALQFGQYGGVKDGMDGCFDVLLLLKSGQLDSAGPCKISAPFKVQASFTNPNFAGATLSTAPTNDVSGNSYGIYTFSWPESMSGTYISPELSLLPFYCRHAEDTLTLKIFSDGNSTACEEIQINWREWAFYEPENRQLSAGDPEFWNWYLRHHGYQTVGNQQSGSSLSFQMMSYPPPAPAPPMPAPAPSNPVITTPAPAPSKPVTQAPTSSKPVTQAPTSSKPVTQAPTSSKPVTPAPTPSKPVIPRLNMMPPAQYSVVKDWMDGCFDVQLLLKSGQLQSGPCALSVPIVVQASFTNPKFAGAGNNTLSTDKNNTLSTAATDDLWSFGGPSYFSWLDERRNYVISPQQDLLQFDCRRANDTLSLKIFSNGSSTACEEMRINWREWAIYESSRPQLSATDPEYWNSYYRYYGYQTVGTEQSRSYLTFQMTAYPSPAPRTPAPTPSKPVSPLVRDASTKSPASKSGILIGAALISSLSLLALAVVYFRHRRRLSANPPALHATNSGASPPTSVSDLPASWYYTTATPAGSALAPASAPYDDHPPPTAPGYLVPQASVAAAVAVALSPAEATMVWNEGGGGGVLAEAHWEPGMGRGSAGESSNIV